MASCYARSVSEDYARDQPPGADAEQPDDAQGVPISSRRRGGEAAAASDGRVRRRRRRPLDSRDPVESDPVESAPVESDPVESDPVERPRRRRRRRRPRMGAESASESPPTSAGAPPAAAFAPDPLPSPRPLTRSPRRLAMRPEARPISGAPALSATPLPPSARSLPSQDVAAQELTLPAVARAPDSDPIVSRTPQPAVRLAAPLPAAVPTRRQPARTEPGRPDGARVEIGLSDLTPPHPALGDVRADAAVSPRMTAIFGGLFGVATIASIVALLIQVFPVENRRAFAAKMAESAPSAPVQGGATPSAAPVRQRTLLPSPWRIDALKGSHKVVRDTMQRRSFIIALTEAGVPKGEVYRILKAMEGVRSFDRTGKKDRFAVAMDRRSKKVVAFEYELDATEVYQAKTGDDGLLRGERLDMKVGEEEFATSFYIGKDFVKSYRAVGLEPGLVGELNNAFNGRTSTEAFEEGGVVRVVVVEKTALGRFVKYARIKAVEYRPPDPAAPPLRAYWFEKSNGYVDEDGRRPSHKGWRTPIPGAPITSNFNPTRMHPVLKRVMPHNGTDFGAPAGTPVYAALRGTVSLVGMHGASGNLVLLEHANGIQTGYAHLSRFAKGIKVGDRVGTRQLVGYVGSTGRSTGPHLHFSAKKNGKFFDSRDLKMDAVQLLPVADRGLFLQERQRLDAALERIPLPAPPPPEPEPDPPAAAAADPDGDDPAPANADPAEADPDGDDGSGDDSGDDKVPAPARSPKGAKGGSQDDSVDLLGEDLSGDIE